MNCICVKQARNQGGRRGEKPPYKIFRPLEKCVGHGVKLLDVV